MNQSFWEEIDRRLSEENHLYNNCCIRSVILEAFPANIVLSVPSLSKIAQLSDDDWRFNLTKFGVDQSMSWSKILRYMSSLNKTYRVSAILSKWSGVNDPRVVAIDDYELLSDWDSVHN